MACLRGRGKGGDGPHRRPAAASLSSSRQWGTWISRAGRTIFALALIELFLVGLWLYLAHMAATSPGASPDAARVIGRTMGAAIGLVLGVSPALYLLARGNDRKAAARKRE
jgi:hypothetical protein